MFRSPETGPVKVLSSEEALDRHIALVQHDGLGLSLNKTGDRWVHHYTNLVGLRGIVRSGAIWVSDYRYLNDRTELSFGLDILEMVLAGPGDDERLEPALLQETLEEIASLKRGGSGFYVFSSSFCVGGNVLSQWRTYGRQDGVAIRFDRSHLVKVTEEQGFRCGIVHYYWADKGSLAPWLTESYARLRDLLTDVEEMGRPPIIDPRLREEATGRLQPSLGRQGVSIRASVRRRPLMWMVLASPAVFRSAPP